MAYTPVNLGSVANDKTGDALRDGFDKINQMFNELYGRWGANNTRNDDYSVTLGTDNTATGDRSAVLGGSGNTAAGHRSAVLGGQEGYTHLFGQLAFASGKIATIGDAQSGELMFRRQMTDATPSRLTSTGFAEWTDNVCNLLNFMAIAGELTVIAKRAGTADAACWRANIGLLRQSGAGTVVLFQGGVSNQAPAASNGVGSAWRLSIAADTTNGGLAITFTGTAGQTVNAVGRLSYAQTMTAS